jgi:hypothetical protein
MDPVRQPPRKFEIMGLCQPVTSSIQGPCHPFYIEYSDNFIAITDLYIRYYGLCTPYNIEYSDLIAKFDFLGIYIRNYSIFTPSNIEYGEFFLVFDVMISI